MQMTRVFKSGNSQAIRLPREFRLQARRVSIRQVGRGLVIEPLADDFSQFAAMLDEFSSDFMAQREQPEGQERERF